MLQVNGYRSFLRISALVTAIVLVFDSGILFPITKQFSDTTMLYLANVGVGATATVPVNEFNELSAQIAERQRILDAKETELISREISARSYNTETSINLSTYILSAILLVQTILIVLNYVMDWVRVRSYRYERQTN